MTYRTPCHARGHFVFWLSPSPCYLEDVCRASGHLVHLVIYCECYGFERVFFTLRLIYFTLLPASIKASLEAVISTSMLTGLYADLRNIAPARLFVWITAIHKRFVIAGSTSGLGVVINFVRFLQDSNSLHYKWEC